MQYFPDIAAAYANVASLSDALACHQTHFLHHGTVLTMCHCLVLFLHLPEGTTCYEGQTVLAFAKVFFCPSTLFLNPVQTRGQTA